MTIVIPYKRDIHDGLELFYALRSIEQNLTGFTDLLIVGKPPDWFKGKWIVSEDYAGRKQFTIYHKLIQAIYGYINNEPDFIMWNDDHILLQPLAVKDFKYWHNGLLSDELKRGLSMRYREAVKNTLEFQSGYNFDIHTPIIYNKDKFKLLFSNKSEEICIKSYYCNALRIEGERMEDCKIDSLLSEEAIKERIKDKLFFSTGSNGIREPMKELLQELYQKPSRWEK